MKVVYQEATTPPPPATVTDYSPYVQALMTSNSGQPPDVIFLVVAQSNVLGLGRALAQAGFKGIQTNAVSYAPQLTSLANGWSAFTQFATPESTNANMQQIVTKLHAAGIADIGQAALGGYFSADMFVQALKKVGKNLTPEAFQKVMSRITYGIDGVIGPTYYPAGFTEGTPCGQLATSNGTAWTVTAPFGCYDLLTQKNGKLEDGSVHQAHGRRQVVRPISLRSTAGPWRGPAVERDAEPVRRLVVREVAPCRSS